MKYVNGGTSVIIVTLNDGIFCSRNRTFFNYNYFFSGIYGTWIEIEPPPSSSTMKYVNGGTSVAIVTMNDGRVWMRTGISTSTPAGLSWVRIPGINFRMVSSTDRFIPQFHFYLICDLYYILSGEVGISACSQNPWNKF